MPWTSRVELQLQLGSYSRPFTRMIPLDEVFGGSKDGALKLQKGIHF